jgi:hypothetical protein
MGVPSRNNQRNNFSFAVRVFIIEYPLLTKIRNHNQHRAWSMNVRENGGEKKVRREYRDNRDGVSESFLFRARFHLETLKGSRERGQIWPAEIKISVPDRRLLSSPHWLCGNCWLPALPRLNSKLINFEPNRERSIIYTSYRTPIKRYSTVDQKFF